MPYTKSVYVNAGTQTYVQANNAETQYDEATQSLGPDVLAAFVLSGLVATKDGVTFSQLDVTAGTAYLTQLDNTLRRRAPTSSTQSTVGHPSTTMYLDLNPDGTWSWATTHSGVAGHLTVASVTTDGSSNISVVTDARPTLLNLFPATITGDIQIGGRHMLDSNTANVTVFSSQSLPGSGMQKYDICVQRGFA